MAIGYGVACPKGKTVKQTRAKAKREDAKQLKAFRDAVWFRQTTLQHGGGLATDIAKCEYCGHYVMRGRDVELTGEVHHRISRRHKATRYEPDNGVLLCNYLVNGCHEKAERGEIEV